ncbi:hypothetical protein KQX54_017575 [Cotesia glomerata]|uniref:Uncharacterized protein n=1 Tax=Cotesia glomerata TaxID=32391 RepID=A0AAV7IAD1_COTGL|nr:hypothetical protein KQX54_017575 [Cotesia glomerata]
MIVSRIIDLGRLIDYKLLVFVGKFLVLSDLEVLGFFLIEFERVVLLGQQCAEVLPLLLYQQSSHPPTPTPTPTPAVAISRIHLYLPPSYNRAYSCDPLPLFSPFLLSRAPFGLGPSRKPGYKGWFPDSVKVQAPPRANVQFVLAYQTKPNNFKSSLN